MATLAFLPWKTIPSEIQLHQFKIYPYRVGGNAEFDLVLSNFHYAADQPINTATIIEIIEQGQSTDLNDYIKQIFELGEFLALSFLCERRLFSHDEYTNYHSLKLILQRYKPFSPGITATARRRDGSSWIYLIDKQAITKAQHHVCIEDDVKLDVNLCLALINYSKLEDRPALESIFFYLQANTDSSDITLQSELILICGAIESICGVKNGNTNEIVEIFCGCLTSSLDIDEELFESERFEKAKKIPSHQRARSIREVWIKDFYITRGDIAHGRKEGKYPSLWSIEEHIILASEIYPLLLKIKLQELNLYTLEDKDLERIFFFDHRISTKTIMKIEEKYGQAVFGWNKSIEDASWDWSFKKEELLKK